MADERIFIFDILFSFTERFTKYILTITCAIELQSAGCSAEKTVKQQNSVPKKSVCSIIHHDNTTIAW